MLSWLNDIKWDADGLVPAIAQDAESGEVLMVAWMNKEALTLTIQKKPGGLLVQIPSENLV